MLRPPSGDRPSGLLDNQPRSCFCLPPPLPAPWKEVQPAGSLEPQEDQDRGSPTCPRAPSTPGPPFSGCGSCRCPMPSATTPLDSKDRSPAALPASSLPLRHLSLTCRPRGCPWGSQAIPSCRPPPWSVRHRQPSPPWERDPRQGGGRKSKSSDPVSLCSGSSIDHCRLYPDGHAHRFTARQHRRVSSAPRHRLRNPHLLIHSSPSPARPPTPTWGPLATSMCEAPTPKNLIKLSSPEWAAAHRDSGTPHAPTQLPTGTEASGTDTSETHRLSAAPWGNKEARSPGSLGGGGCVNHGWELGGVTPMRIAIYSRSCQNYHQGFTKGCAEGRGGSNTD